MRQAIDDSRLKEVETLYYKKGKSMKAVSESLGVSIDAVVYFMRKHNLKRRSFSEISRISFANKSPSFALKSGLSTKDKEIKLLGTMLYWAEGYKGNETSGYNSVDFANSDPDMIKLFMLFLRRAFVIDEKRLRVLLYCYSNQNVLDLVKYWSILTRIPSSQFSKPYVRTDFRTDGRKMLCGMIHIRYADKKLLIEIKKLIDCYKAKYAPVV